MTGLVLAAALASSLATGAPLTLDDALQLAASHPTVLSARDAEAQAAGRLREAQAGLRPSMNLQLGASLATGNFTSQPGMKLKGAASEPTNDTFPFYSAALSISQTVWDFGRTHALVEAARSNERVAALDRREAEADLVVAVKTAYLAVLGAERLRSASEASLEAARRHLSLAEAAVQVGQKPPYDAVRAKVDVGNAEVSLLQAGNVVRLGRADLSRAVGEDVGGRPLIEMAAEHREEPSLDLLLGRALSHRPELAEQDARIAAQAAQLEAARSQYWPTLALTGQTNARGSQAPLVPNWQAGATLSLPLLAGGADAARIDQQAAQLAALSHAREVLVLDLRRDLERQLATLAEARARKGALAKLLEQVREGLRLAEGRYAAGLATFVELGDAQASLASTEAQEIRAALDEAVARAGLERLVGDAL
jgi:outer membrane protein